MSNLDNIMNTNTIEIQASKPASSRVVMEITRRVTFAISRLKSRNEGTNVACVRNTSVALALPLECSFPLGKKLRWRNIMTRRFPNACVSNVPHSSIHSKTTCVLSMGNSNSRILMRPRVACIFPIHPVLRKSVVMLQILSGISLEGNGARMRIRVFPFRFSKRPTDWR